MSINFHFESFHRVYERNWLNLKFCGGGPQVEPKPTSSGKNLLIFGKTTLRIAAQLMSRHCSRYLADGAMGLLLTPKMLARFDVARERWTQTSSLPQSQFRDQSNKITNFHDYLKYLSNCICLSWQLFSRRKISYILA